MFLAAEKKYPTLTRVMNDINQRLISQQLVPELQHSIEKKFDSHVEKPASLPQHVKCLMQANQALQLNSEYTKKGAAIRFVATETLTFLVDIVQSIHHRLLTHTPKSKHNQVEILMETLSKVVNEFKTYMYRNVPTLLIKLGTKNDASGVMGQIEKVNWALKQSVNEPNEYVGQLLIQFEQIEKVLSSFTTLPKFIHYRLNCETIVWIQELMVSAYSDSKKCTIKGRFLMSLDQTTFQKGLKKISNTEPLPDWKYMDNFIQAYYLPKDDLIKWCEQHVEYPFKVMHHLSITGKAQDNLTRTQKHDLQIAMTNAYVLLLNSLSLFSYQINIYIGGIIAHLLDVLF